MLTIAPGTAMQTCRVELRLIFRSMHLSPAPAGEASRERPKRSDLRCSIFIRVMAIVFQGTPLSACRVRGKVACSYKEGARLASVNAFRSKHLQQAALSAPERIMTDIPSYATQMSHV